VDLLDPQPLTDSDPTFVLLSTSSHLTYTYSALSSFNPNQVPLPQQKWQTTRERRNLIRQTSPSIQACTAHLMLPSRILLSVSSDISGVLLLSLTCSPHGGEIQSDWHLCSPTQRLPQHTAAHALQAIHIAQWSQA
jgi:hypothetical protein